MKIVIYKAAAVLCLLSPVSVHAQGDAERGAYLVQGIMGCGNCHTPLGPDGFIMEQDLGGRLVEDNPMFTAIAPNITPGAVWPTGPMRSWRAPFGKAFAQMAA